MGAARIPAVDRQRLATCVDELARAIARGEVSIDGSVPTLLALATLCSRQGLTREAERVRSWIRART